MHHLLLIVHLISATVWIGGHLILCLTVLPKALREKDPGRITHFESHYEKIGIPALLLLVISGVMLSNSYGVRLSQWFSFSSPIEKIVSTKLILLFATLGLAIHARLFIIPKLEAKSIVLMAMHIIMITLVGLTMMVVGTFVRFGGF